MRIRRSIAGVIIAVLFSRVWFLVHLDRPIGVVIITLDTTRADRLSPYGFMDASMPHLDRLAREGIVFDQATSQPSSAPANCVRKSTMCRAADFAGSARLVVRGSGSWLVSLGVPYPQT